MKTRNKLLSIIAIAAIFCPALSIGISAEAYNYTLSNYVGENSDLTHESLGIENGDHDPTHLILETKSGITDSSSVYLENDPGNTDSAPASVEPDEGNADFTPIATETESGSADFTPNNSTSEAGNADYTAITSETEAPTTGSGPDDLSAPDTDGSEGSNEASESDNLGEIILSAISDHSGEILSLLAFVGSIILAIAYKLGLTPLVRGALSSMLNSLGVLKESVAKSDEKCSGAVAVLEERIGATEDIVKRLDEAIASSTEAIKAEEANSGERADMRLIMQMQINMLYDIFMTSALPQYEKDAVGERISAMNKILSDRRKGGKQAMTASDTGGAE